MPKRWDGKTPYDDTYNDPEGNYSLSLAIDQLKQRGFSAAMNSPEVVAMYRVVEELCLPADGLINVGRYELAAAQKALAAYEAGLVEMP